MTYRIVNQDAFGLVVLGIIFGSLADEDSLRLRLAFNCRDCLMEIYWP